MEEPKIQNSKEPWLAVGLSAMITGFGQIYSGNILTGIFFFSIKAASLLLAFWFLFSKTGNVFYGLIFFLLAFSIYIWNVIDAFFTARKQNETVFETERKQNKDAWLAVFLNSIIPGTGNLYLKNWILGIILIVFFFGVIVLEQLTSLFTLLPIYYACGCYIAYTNAPVRREASKKLIIIFVVLVFCITTIENYFPVYIKNYYRSFAIPSNTMKPTLIARDRVIVNITTNYVPNRGELVVFKRNDNLFIKRVVAIEGDEVEIDERFVKVNGIIIRQSDIPIEITDSRDFKNFNNVIVPKGSVYLLNDNVEIPTDSRMFGPISVKDIIGIPYLIFYPFERSGPIE